MKDKAINSLYLRFDDKETERKFIKEYDTENRIFFRLAIYLSCFAWFIHYLGIYFSYPNAFQKALMVLISVLLVPFIVVVALSYYKKYSTVNHHIIAFGNWAAAIVCIYIAVYLMKDVTFLCSGIVCIYFFGYFIIRIRFKVSLFVTLSYGLIAQYCVITSGNFNNTEIYESSSGIWLGFFIATLAGYFFEKTNRKIFIQNKLIEEQKEELIVERNKLKQSLADLKSTQTQLIQKEKMASLGELTSGIAHEIQNPLNFVNNFSELSVDLVKDLKDEIEKPDIDKEYVGELFTDLASNQEKINHHGKRASNIVKGMLEHSRASTGVKELTDINKLVDESLRLSYHAMRAKDKNFNADYSMELDEAIGKINIIPQDMGRVLINLFNNAFYAVASQPLKEGLPYNDSKGENYVPLVSVSTHYVSPPLGGSGGACVIKVKDNGGGIPDNIKQKIFQPFFTTKPTGEGTGLGLSLSYDIVVKGHGGSLEVESTVTPERGGAQGDKGVGSAFIITLPF